jgi:hypothetical protein
MLIIAFLYVGAAWLLFFRFKLLPWNWPWRIVTALLGCFILAVFLALLNTLTPSGRIAVVGRVVEVTPGTDQHRGTDAPNSDQVRVSSRTWIGVTSDSGKLALMRGQINA